MIFSLKKGSSFSELAKIPSTDIFCFFYHPDSVTVPEEELLKSILSSLRLKKNVLILEQFIHLNTQNFSSKWEIGDDWIWIASRSYRVLLEAMLGKEASYDAIRAFLISGK